MVRCIICEKNTKTFLRMEFDIAICKICYEKIFPLVVKQKVLGNEENILMELGYHERNNKQNDTY